MPEPGNKPRKYWRVMALAGAALVVLVIVAGWFVHTPRFRDWLRGRVVARLEQVTGGRVELRSLYWDLARLEFEARDLTIHGLERADEVPYVHVDRLLLRVRIVSLFRRQIGLRYLELDRPVLHVIIYPDGSTNQPVPKNQGNGAAKIEELFDLAVDRTEIQDGVLLVNDRPLPLGLTADELALTLSYVRAERSYTGDLRFERLETKYTSLGGMAASGAARFRLQRDRVRLDSLNLSSGRSHLHVLGEMRDFHQPAIDISYDSTLDIAQLAPILHVRELRSGTVQIDGQASGTSMAYRLGGKLVIRDLDYSRGDLRVSNLSAAVNFAADKNKLTLSNLFVSAFGGIAQGGAEFYSASRTSSRGQAISDPRGTISLRVRGLLISRLAEAVSTRSLPLDRIRLTGAATGTLAIRWRRSPANFLADLQIDVTPPARVAADELPVDGHVAGSYDHAGRVLRFADLRLATRATQVTASGVLGSGTENLQVSFNTHDLGEWKPVVAAFGGPAQLPVELHGRASFNGALRGKINTPAVAGHLQVLDFDSLIAPRKPDRGSVASIVLPSRHFHWDALDGQVEYSGSRVGMHGAVLKRSASQVEFDLTAMLQEGRFTDQSSFTLRASVHDAQIADVLSLAGYRNPVSGVINGRLQVSGTESDPHGGGNLLVTNLRIYGEPVQRFSADLRFAQHEAQLLNINVVQNGGVITGSAGYNPVSTAYHFDLRGVNISLAKLHHLQARRTVVSGFLNFSVAGQGTRDAPAINGRLQLHDVVMNDEHLGGLDVSAATSGETLRLVARSDFEHADLEADGTVRLRGEFPAKLDVRLNHLDIDPLIHSLMKGRITGHSVLTGRATLDGSLISPVDLAVAGEITALSADIEHIQLHNEGPIRFVVADRSLRVQQLQIAGNDTALSATGSAQFSGLQALDVNAKGHVNLRLLASLDPSIVSYGMLTMDLRVGGTTARPLIDGQLDLANAGISHVDLPNGLSGLNGRLVFTEDRLQVQNLTAKTGGGTLEIGGFVAYGRGMAFNLTGRGHEIRLRYPPGVSAVADADLRLTGDPQDALLSGDVTVTRFGVNPEFDFSTYLARAKQAGPAPNPSSLLSRLRLDVHIVSPPELHVQTSLAKISGDVDLRLRGTAARPVLLGRVNIIEGEIYFNATKYRLERGSVVFPNPVSIQPVLDIEATTTVRDYDITLGFHGPMEKLSTTYRSDPPLATADIVSLLAFGRTRDETAAQSSPGGSNLAPETQTVLYQALNAAVSSRVQKLFGVSRIKIDPQAGGADNNALGPRLTIEQQVANNITLTYITDVGHTNYQTIQAEYNINRNVSIVAVRDWNGVVSFDLRIRQRKR